MAGGVKVGQAFRIAGPPAGKPAVPRLPGAAVMVRNLVGSAVEVVRGAAAGVGVIAPSAESDRRHALCRENRCGAYLADRDRCSDCGCWMGIKAWLVALRCPRDIW